MKTANPVLDTLVENQTHFVNNWMDSAKKMQAAFTSGNIVHEGQSLYKEYFDKQMSLLSKMQQSSAEMFGQQDNDPQGFFKNWFNQQAAYAKQMGDFGQSINNSYQNFGKPAHDYMSNFGQANTAFTNIYNSLLNTLNTSYDSMSKNMNGAFNKDTFSNFVQGNQMYYKMQEFFQPIMNSIQKGQFNMDAFKNQFSANSYNDITKQIFGNMYNTASTKEFYDNGIKQLQDFFTNQNNLGKEYYAQMQNISKEFPQLFNGDSATTMKDFYGKMTNVFGKTFEPLLKVVAPGKEKENVEEMISLMDKLAAYSVKQAELQAFLQTTTKTSVEKIAQKYAEKYSDPKTYTTPPSVDEMYNEWVKTNETLFTELFASEEFSKVKGDALNLSMDVKKHFEKQMESSLENFPVVLKSEVEDMQKTIYELKKQVKDLQSKITMQGAAAVEIFEEDKNAKARKK
ncbi:MAG TPA: poly(R)-hydroxyalkanoic acid synthase subunit PhaE [Bacteroidia bacterium]|nr:poly(R)-hydroxyalkanoic acid synthase subunit PhaE [Bacteroidia bacterium]